MVDPLDSNPVQDKVKMFQNIDYVYSMGES
jgi:hypothetical protein